MRTINSSDIFNYEFECFNNGICTSKCDLKDKCCKKYKRKGKNYCKKCPKQAA